MARLLKCYGQDCISHNIKHPKEDLTKFSGKNYCPNCYDKIVKETEERNNLYDYVAKVYDMPFPTPLMKKHIKELREGYGWSYKRIKVLIHYVVNVENNVIDAKYGLRHYANYYQSMIRYYSDKKKRKENNQGKRNRSRTITMDSSRFLNNKYKNEQLFDMEDE